MFNDMISNIDDDVSRYVLRAQIRDNLERVQVAKPTHTSSGKEESKRKPRSTSKVYSTKWGAVCMATRATRV